MNYRKFTLSNVLKAKPPWTAFLLFAARCPNALFLFVIFASLKQAAANNKSSP